MVLWTIQTDAWYRELCARSRLQGCWRYADHDFEHAYRWMAAQMIRRGVAGPIEVPVFAWYAWGGAHRRRPDLRCSGHLPTGTRGVLVEIDVSPERALLSQFEMWHCVLNRTCVTADEKAFEEMDRRARAQMLGRAEMEATWEHIFDLEYGDTEWWGPPETRSVQACLGYVDMKDLRAVRPFTAR